MTEPTAFAKSCVSVIRGAMTAARGMARMLRPATEAEVEALIFTPHGGEDWDRIAEKIRRQRRART